MRSSIESAFSIDTDANGVIEVNHAIRASNKSLGEHCLVSEEADQDDESR